MFLKEEPVFFLIQIVQKHCLLHKVTRVSYEVSLAIVINYSSFIDEMT